VNALVRVLHGMVTVYLDRHQIAHLLLCKPRNTATTSRRTSRGRRHRRRGRRSHSATDDSDKSDTCSPLGSVFIRLFSFSQGWLIDSHRHDSRYWIDLCRDDDDDRAGAHKVAMSRLPPARRARSRTGSVVHREGGRAIRSSGSICVTWSVPSRPL